MKSKIHLVVPDLCTKCGERPKKKNHSWCQVCVNELERKSWHNKPRWKRQEKWLKNRYGKDYEWYHSTWLKQNKSCAICGNTIYLEGDHGHKKCCVDHDHKTNEVRGLLCNHCNRALGLFNDDLETVSQAFDYLRSYKYDE